MGATASERSESAVRASRDGRFELEFISASRSTVWEEVQTNVLRRPHGRLPLGAGRGTLAIALVIVLSSSASAQVSNAIRLTHDGHFKQRPAWSPDGKQVVFSRHRGDKIGLVVINADGSDEKPISNGKLPQYDACWSPDGKRLVFTHVPQSPGQGNLEVYLCEADGSDLKKVAGDVKGLSHEEYPAWSPDGTRIAYSSTFEGNQEIYTVDVEGKHRVRLTSDPAFDAHPAWSPDGKRIAFATSRWGDFEIALMDSDGGNVTRLTESRGLDDYPVFSPDGTRIACTSNRDGNYEIYVMNADGSGAVNATQNAALDHFPAWTPDGRLSFVSNRDDEFDLYVLPAALLGTVPKDSR